MTARRPTSLAAWRCRWCFSAVSGAFTTTSVIGIGLRIGLRTIWKRIAPAVASFIPVHRHRGAISRGTVSLVAR
jgi:hypothetical protein